ncbi:MAG: family 20 glycosylhydrolase [Terracidiphilus sp.]
MRRSIAVFTLLLSCAAAGAFAQTAAPTCADLRLVPAPRECIAVQPIPIGGIGFFVTADKNVEDQFAVEDLIEDRLGKRTVRSDAPFIRLERAQGDAAQALLAANHLSFDPAMHNEGYILVPDGQGGLAVIAETSAGIFYGAQTVKQLIRGSGQDAVLLVPTLRDWPAMAYRGLSDDWSRGPLPNLEFLKREIRTLAAYKINIFSPYFEHTFAYDVSPVAAFPGGAMTPDEARELVAYAAQYHITVIPEQESFGHLHHLLKFEQFSTLSETPHGSVLAPGEAVTLPLISSWFTELAKVFPAPYAHIGADETNDLGLGKTREKVEQQGLDAVYIDFLKQIHSTLAPNHKRLLFWGDIAVKSPELVGTLPKDMIAVPWEYRARPDYKPIIEPFIQAGLETWVSPGVSNWGRLYPNNNDALANIRVFVRDGQAMGATGVLNTVWNDDGEGIFDQNWFGVLFGAAAGWQSGESSEEAFSSSFGQAFHGDPTGKIDLAQRELMAAHDSFKEADLHDARDVYFWIDPFSPEGERVAAKLRPYLSDLRLHAERAITLVAEARIAARQENRVLENTEALDALELGARRIDFVGLKFQAADESVALYSQARAMAADKSRRDDVEAKLDSIGANNGLLQDMRDGYALLGGLYRQAWLRDNRSYWLENNQARYNRAAQLWIGRGDRWNVVLEQWWTTHTLASPAEVGLAVQSEK